MLLHAAPDSGYVYLSWNTVPIAKEYRVEWRRLSTQRWQVKVVDAPAYFTAIPFLENDVTYEFRISASADGGGINFVSPVVRVAPSTRTECLTANQFGCTVAGFRDFLNAAPIGQPYRCDGRDLTEPNADMPNCVYVSGDRIFGFDRFLGKTFRASPVPPKALVREAGRLAIWGGADPFNSPELFSLPVRPLGIVDRGDISEDYATASSYIIRQTQEVSSRFTIFTPKDPIPGQFMVYMEGHGLTANTSAADFLGWFLDRGWTVASMDMPLEGANATDARFPVDAHDAFRFYAPARARPLDSFLLPVKIVIDQLLESSPVPNPNIVLAGRSGGGWTACVYGALDERVTVAINISGCWPRSIAMDPAVLSNPNVLHYEYLQPKIFDEVSMLDFITSAGTRGNFHFYSSNDPSIKLSVNHPFVQYLRGIGAVENAVVTTRNRTRVQVGVQTGHGLEEFALAALQSYLRDLGLPVTVLAAAAEVP